MSRRIKLATAISHYIFTSTQSGFRFRTRKKLIVGQGISMEQFVCADRPERTELALLFVGRLSPIKGIPTIFAACEILKKEGIPFHLTVVGGANIPLEEAHKKELETYVDVHNLQEEITFVGSVPNRELRSYLCDADIFLNPGRTGSLDKAGVEAMAAGLVVLTCNEAYEEVLGEEHTDELMFPKDDAFTLASRIKDFADKEKRVMVGMRLRELANTHHSVEGLIERIHRVYVH